MTTTVWTTLVALSAIGLTASPLAGPRSAAVDAPVSFSAGGPPDTLVANPAATSIRWKGTARGTREGSVRLASGLFVIRHERLTSGTFTIDMRSVAVAGAPIIAPASRRIGEHLAGPAFFDAARYPTAVFRSTGSRRVGQARWQVTGDLTLHGVTRPLTFETDVRWAELGHMVATTTFTIDRRQFGVGTGGSGLADELLDDDIQLAISLDASRKQARVATR
jgi:polyisoprenoid-binding protein YceI